MFKKILIANRGEIALRVIRACKEMGIATVAVYSEADKSSLHVKHADEAYCLGRASSAETYLNYPKIIRIAKDVHAEAIHPGYGFLSENTLFAEVCEMVGVRFIGPRHEAIAKMGEKSVARRLMEEAGVPVPPGSGDAVRDERQALAAAANIGFPLLVKASAGGGGKGMRIVRSEADLAEQFSMARIEAKAAFGNDDVYLERFVDRARHIEIQILADDYGNVVHLGERECSVQRRHQKLLEEAPSPALSGSLRTKMGKAAVAAAKAVGYSGAGTVEFVIGDKGEFFFIEMNTRLQVEHGITEAVTGIDIVKEQIRVAAGEKLGYKQRNITLVGHSIECRINAEDPDKGFAPDPGKIKHLSMPGGPGVRLDTHLYCGYTVPSHYDSLLAKLIVHAPTRPEAILRMRRALQEFDVDGIATTVPYHLRILENASFLQGEYTTKLVEEELAAS